MGQLGQRRVVGILFALWWHEPPYIYIYIYIYIYYFSEEDAVGTYVLHVPFSLKEARTLRTLNPHDPQINLEPSTGNPQASWSAPGGKTRP